MRLRRWILRPVVAALFLVAPAVHATAQSPPGPRVVTVSVGPCDTPPLDWNAVLDRLEVELRDLGARLDREASADAGQGIARLELRVAGCDAAARAMSVGLTSVATGRSTEASVAIPGPQVRGRSRVVALALVELIRARWPALGLDPAARIVSLEEAQDRVAEQASRQGARLEDMEPRLSRALLEVGSMAALIARLEVDATEAREERDELARTRAPTISPPGVLVDVQVALGVYAAAGAGLVGIRAGVEIPLDAVRFLVRVGGDFGPLRTELGDVDLFSAHGSLSLLGSYHEGPLSVSAGPRITVGWARAEGRPFDPRLTHGESVEAAVVTPALSLRLHTRLADMVRVSVDLELGYALGGVDARIGDRRVAGLIGPVLVVGLGTSFEL